MSAPWALLSYLLRYPDEQADVAGEVAALPAGPVRESLERFLAAAPGPAHYVETFDLRRRYRCLNCNKAMPRLRVSP